MHGGAEHQFFFFNLHEINYSINQHLFPSHPFLIHSHPPIHLLLWDCTDQILEFRFFLKCYFPRTLLANYLPQTSHLSIDGATSLFPKTLFFSS